MNGGLHDILHSSIHNEGLNDGWNLILESIMCGYGNHECYIKFITSGKALMESYIDSTCTSAVYSPIKHSW